MAWEAAPLRMSRNDRDFHGQLVSLKIPAPPKFHNNPFQSEQTADSDLAILFVSPNRATDAANAAKTIVMPITADRPFACVTSIHRRTAGGFLKTFFRRQRPPVPAR
jgi:hypothetical protein